jgi:Protein of unknown function (DUF3558)
MERHQVRRTALFVTTLAALVGLVGCSSETPGNAIPGDDETGLQVPTEGGGETEPPETSETETETSSGAASLEPCELLSPEDLAALSLGPGEEDAAAGARSCSWQTAGGQVVGADIWDDLGIGDVQSKSTPQPKTVGSHKATQYVGELGACAVAIELTATSRVDVIGVADGDLAKACQIANDAANLVERKLP